MSSRPPLNLKNLLYELESVDDWQGVGIQLGISYGELKIIERECFCKIAECKRELFHKWLSRVHNPTWALVVEALRQMKLINIAEKIEEKCCHGFSEQHSDTTDDMQSDLLEHSIGIIQPVSLDSTQEDPSHDTRSATPQPESVGAAVSLGAASFSDLAVVPLSAIPSPIIPEIAPARIAEIRSQVEVLEADFLMLVCRAEVDLAERVSNSPNLLSQFCTAVFNIPASRKRPHVKFLAEKRKEIVRAPSVSDLISILSLHWDFINTPFLEVLVKSFGGCEVKRELSDYVKKLGQFCRTTKLYEYKSAFPSTTIAVPPGFCTITVKFQADSAKYTLEKALQCGWQLSEECCLEKYTLLFVDCSFGSISLVWALPRGAISILVESLTVEFRERSGIAAVYIDIFELRNLPECAVFTGEDKDPSGNRPGPVDLGPEDGGDGHSLHVTPPTDHPPAPQEEEPTSLKSPATEKHPGPSETHHSDTTLGTVPAVESTPIPPQSAEEGCGTTDIALWQRKAYTQTKLSSNVPFSPSHESQAQEYDSSAKVENELAPFVLRNVEGLGTSKTSGAGAYGSVCEATVDGIPCIAKCLHDISIIKNVSTQKREAVRKRFLEECALLSRLNHPNIVQFMGVHYGRNTSDISLIMECLHSNLCSLIESHPNIPMSVKLVILLDISHGLLYLHTHNPPIVHRDLSANNILLTDDLHAKIAHLGISKLFDFHTQVATAQTKATRAWNYMPPEALSERPIYDVKFDVFSFGHLSLYTAIQEFPEVLEMAVKPEMLKEGSVQIAKRKGAIDKMGTGHCLYSLVLQCLSDAPAKRPTTANLNVTLKRFSQKHPRSLAEVLKATVDTEILKCTILTKP